MKKNSLFLILAGIGAGAGILALTRKQTDVSDEIDKITVSAADKINKTVDDVKGRLENIADDLKKRMEALEEKSVREAA